MVSCFGMTFVLLLTLETFFSPCATSISSPEPSQKRAFVGKGSQEKTKNQKGQFFKKRANGVEDQNEGRKSGDPAGDGHRGALTVPASCRGVLAGSAVLPVGSLS